MFELIYEDENGKITGRKDKDTGSLVLIVKYKNIYPESITVPEESVENIVFFLNKKSG